jgi:hypothetical protein
MLPFARVQSTECSGMRWRVDGVEGVCVNDNLTLLRDLECGAELRFSEGRLTRGAGYGFAQRRTRQSLARTGAILRLRQRNRFYVHASGVVDPRGRAFVFAGESGSGKSTVAFALARLGWTLLGDDGVVLEPLADTIIVHGWRSPLLVSTSLQRFFPELEGSADRVIAGDARGRIPCHVNASPRAMLSALVFLKQGPSGSLRSCADNEALMLLIRQSPWVLLGDRYSREHFRALQQIVSGTRALSLVHGPDELMRIGELFNSTDSGLLGASV